MAGRSKSKAVATRPEPIRNQRTVRRSRAKGKAYGELMLVASEQGVKRRSGQSAADVLQECLDRAVGGMRYAASEVDKLQPEEFWVRKFDAQGNALVEPNKWYQLELTCREEVERLADIMSKLGIEERRVQVEEAKAALMVAAVREAARDAGLSPGDVRKLGAALRSRVEAMAAAGQAVAA